MLSRSVGPDELSLEPSIVGGNVGLPNEDKLVGIVGVGRCGGIGVHELNRGVKVLRRHSWVERMRGAVDGDELEVQGGSRVRLRAYKAVWDPVC